MNNILKLSISLTKYIGIVAFFLFFSFAVFSVSAQQNTDSNCDSAVDSNCEVSTRLNNPLGDDITNLPDFIKKLVDIVFLIAIPILAMFFIYSGYLFVEAQGSEAKLKLAKQTFFNTVIGATILLGAWVIAEAIQGTVDQLRD